MLIISIIYYFTININSFIITVPSPKDNTFKIDLLVTPKGTCKTKVDIVNGSPYVKINGSFNAKIYSMDEYKNYLDSDFLDSLSNTCNIYLENVLLNYLYKTSLEFKSDISDIGKYALSKKYYAISKHNLIRAYKLASHYNFGMISKITTALTELRSDFDCFKSHLPETVTVPKQNGVYVPYSPVTAVPNCVAAQYGFGPYAGFGFNNSGSLWG